MLGLLRLTEPHHAHSFHLCESLFFPEFPRECSIRSKQHDRLNVHRSQFRLDLIHQRRSCAAALRSARHKHLLQVKIIASKVGLNIAHTSPHQCFAIIRHPSQKLRRIEKAVEFFQSLGFRPLVVPGLAIIGRDEEGSASS